ncbi:MAG: FG-GAP repeat protein [Anaerolineaceae bacterium]|nr:FG-GAP repeat protein [Anaerolineaceae bacterium]
MKTKVKLPILITLTFSLLLAAVGSGILPGIQTVVAETSGVILLSYPTWTYTGNSQGTRMGSAVSSAGDVNGDGLDDVLVGAEKFEITEYREGASFIFYNTGSGLLNFPNWSMGGGQQGAMFGNALSGLGRVNNDRFDDIAVGASDYNLMDGDTVIKSKVGAVYAYYGEGTFSSKTSADWSFIGDQIDARLGSSVNGLGDLNKDGYADLIVGAPYYDENELSNNGKAYIFFGSEDGLGTDPGWTAIGNNNAALFGSSAASAGDVNGDGWNDVIIGAPRPGIISNPQIGYVYVFYNSASGLSLTPSWSETNGFEGAWFGATVAGLGDVNRDGYDDVLVGAPFTKVTIDGLEQPAGCIYLYLGSPSGLKASPAWIRCGTTIGGKFGHSVAAAGDINQDSCDDFLVGEPFFSLSNEKQGAVYLFFGSLGGVRTDYYERTLGNKSDTEFGTSVSTAGFINVDDRMDVIVGAPNYKASGIRPGRVMTYFAGIQGIPDEEALIIYLPLLSDGN